MRSGSWANSLLVRRLVTQLWGSCNPGESRDLLPLSLFHCTARAVLHGGDDGSEYSSQPLSGHSPFELPDVDLALSVHGPFCQVI